MAVESRDGSFSWGGAKDTAQPDETPMEVDTPFKIMPKLLGILEKSLSQRL
ncbi:hypothetical protein SAMN05660472_01081 [Natronincola ferrireducens]|uniref:Uncharacterized protein n=2 Tax=Natronincola ferrireducens TaxID=393762 RepID=A0A1G9A9Z1_9FIRM|nr:hypothetical protein SAMN05660472_01081 [Natronincola ferrireducens]